MSVQVGAYPNVCANQAPQAIFFALQLELRLCSVELWKGKADDFVKQQCPGADCKAYGYRIKPEDSVGKQPRLKSFNFPTLTIGIRWRCKFSHLGIVLSTAEKGRKDRKNGREGDATEELCSTHEPHAEGEGPEI